MPGPADEPAYAVDVTYIATNGWTTQELAAGIAQRRQGLTPPYDLVSLLIGVNNQFRGAPVSSYPRQLRGLLDTAIELAGGDRSKVFMVSIPDYAFTPFGQSRPGVSEGIDAYNAAGAEVAAEYGIPFYDITPISREGLNQPELVASDRLHPSGEQYRLWVEGVLLAPVRGLLE